MCIRDRSLIDEKKPENYNVNVAKALKHWKDDHFKWAINYIYGIEKDYRLVKVGKVGCYLHGDGLALSLIHILCIRDSFKCEAWKSGVSGVRY